MAENSTQQTKLDSFIKNSLKEYEVPADMSGWGKMEQMLDKGPGSASAFKNKAIIGSVAAGILAIATVSVIYLSNPSDNVEEHTTQPANTEETTTASPVISEPMQNDLSAGASEIKSPESSTSSLPVITHEETTPVKTDEGPVKIISDTKLAEDTEGPEEISKNEKNKTNSAEDDAAKTNAMEVFDMLKKKDNVPTFPDMIDPAKGFTKKTEEDEHLQKEALKKLTEEHIFGEPANNTPPDSSQKKSTDPY